VARPCPHARSRRVSARARILGAIRAQLGRGELSGDAQAELAQRIARHRPNVLPARAQGSRRELVDRFVQMAQAVACTVERLDDAAGVPAAVVDYLRRHNLPQRVTLAPDPAVQALPWETQPLLERRTGRAADEDLVAVTATFGAVAETGTLVACSGPEHPTTLNFLPDHHVVALRTSQIAGSYEAVWERLRAARGDGQMPRTVNMITGPSRTGDIELTIHLGAHGPRSLHILLIDDEGA